MTDCW